MFCQKQNISKSLLLLYCLICSRLSIAIGKSQVGETTRHVFLKELLRMFARNDHTRLLKVCYSFIVRSILSQSIAIGKQSMKQPENYFRRNLKKCFVRNRRFLKVYYWFTVKSALSSQLQSVNRKSVKQQLLSKELKKMFCQKQKISKSLLLLYCLICSKQSIAISKSQVGETTRQRNF